MDNTETINFLFKLSIGSIVECTEKLNLPVDKELFKETIIKIVELKESLIKQVESKNNLVYLNKWAESLPNEIKQNIINFKGGL